MKKAKVSVIVPVYNVEEYLSKCLDSLVNQTLNDIEIIIVNDGSQDNCQTIIDEYKNQYPSVIKSFIKENGGQGSARNFGIKVSNGEYIAFVDSDDYVDYNMFEELYIKAKLDDLDIVLCKNFCVDEAGHIINSQKLYDEKNHLFDYPAVWNKIYKSSILKKNNILFRNKVWYEDIDFTFKTYTATNKIGHIDKEYYYYLIRTGSTMNNNNIERNKEIFLAFDEIISYLQSDNKYNDLYPIVEYLAIKNIYISAIVRIIRMSNVNNIEKNIIPYLDYINKNFQNFKKNIFKKKLSLNQRIVFKLLNLKQYLIVKLVFKIKR